MNKFALRAAVIAGAAMPLILTAGPGIAQAAVTNAVIGTDVWEINVTYTTDGSADHCEVWINGSIGPFPYDVEAGGSVQKGFAFPGPQWAEVKCDSGFTTPGMLVVPPSA